MIIHLFILDDSFMSSTVILSIVIFARTYVEQNIFQWGFEGLGGDRV